MASQRPWLLRRQLIAPAMLGLALSSCDSEEPPTLSPHMEEKDPCKRWVGIAVAQSQADLELYVECDLRIPLEISGSVESLAPLRGKKSLRTMSIRGTSISSLEDLKDVSTIGGLVLTDMRIEALDLPNLETAYGITLDGNRQLRSARLPRLTQSPYMSFKRNPVLTEISFPVCSLGDEGQIVLRDNPKLENVDFGAVNRLSCLDIVGCGLADLTGFGALQTISGVTTNHDGLYGMGLRLHNNPKLVSLAGLENLTSVSIRLSIMGNDELSSLDGLSGLNPYEASGEEALPFFIVSDNPKLPTCAVDEVSTRLGLHCECSDNDLDGTCSE